MNKHDILDEQGLTKIMAWYLTSQEEKHRG